MRKNEAAAFADFLLDEATKYGRQISKGEIDLWFETFQRCAIDDFKRAWVEHKRDEKNGHFFPKIPWLQRQLKLTSAERPETDWRCCEEINGQRCGFPGAINAGRGWQCSGHFRITGSVEYTPAASLQIIEASQGYTAPKTPMELMERGEQQRAIEGERWRKAMGIATVARLAKDPLAAPRMPEKPESHHLEAPVEDDANLAAQLAADDEARVV